MKPITILLLLMFCLSITSCKTQIDLKHRLYCNITNVDTVMNHRILKNFSNVNQSADLQIYNSLALITTQSDSIKSRKLRADLRLYIELTNKIIMLHQDPRINYDALGPLLNSYTGVTTRLYDKLNDSKMDVK